MSASALWVFADVLRIEPGTADANPVNAPVAFQRWFATAVRDADTPDHGKERRTVGEKVVRLLERDPELGLRVPPGLIASGREELVARAITFEPGVWAVPSDIPDRRGLGYFIVEGVLACEMLLVGSNCAELLGDGDVLQPVISREDRLVRYHLQWHVLEPVTMAVLDERFAQKLAVWPSVLAAILERAERRAHRLAVHQAILQLSPVETRLLMLFWHLAERWGRVTPDGIALSLALSHEMLGHLVGCRRASVTTAVSRVCESGRLDRRADGAWLLKGSPPGELAPLHWQERRAAPSPGTGPAGQSRRPGVGPHERGTAASRDAASSNERKSHAR